MTSAKPGTNQPSPGDFYRGRFAPSPTGPLHIGSLVAAIASYLEALTRRGEWLVRIEDIDPPRQVAGAADAILTSLERHGFHWDGAPLFQGTNVERFQQVTDDLLDAATAYYCRCSREEIRRIATRFAATGPVYPGTCRDRSVLPSGDRACAVRVRTAGTTVQFDDRLQGQIDCDVECEIGDFVVRRKDGLIAYSLAVVVDDHDQGITDIVRGADLFEFTPAQIHLQRLLAFDTPSYCHVPIVANRDGQKLSKQTGAAALDDANAARNLVDGLDLLGQAPPRELGKSSVSEVWAWAKQNWSLKRVANPGVPRCISSQTD